MPSLWVSQFRPTPSGGLSNNGLPILGGVLSNTVVALTASASTLALSSVAGIVLLQSDVAAWIFVGSSASTGVATSTQGFRIPANVPPIPINVPASGRLVAVST